MTEKYKPEPDSECHDLPWRPRSSVCSSAPTTVPDRATDAANRLASVMVESMTACHSMRRPSNRACTAPRSNSGLSQTIEGIAIFLHLLDISCAFGAQFFHDVRRSSGQELLAAELAINLHDQLLQLIVVLEQPVAQRFA